jgi:SAM-dependent methyltransferase
VDHAEMVALLRGGVSAPGGVWAELGAGAGNFTRALRDLIGPQSVIYAVDRDSRAVAQLRAAATEPGAAIRPLQGDFTRPLELPPLDGALLANALHFVRDQSAVLRLVAGYLRPGGKLLLVEYARSFPLPWIPFPIPFERFQALARASGLTAPTLIGTRRSPSSGGAMYAAMAGLRADMGAETPLA